MVLLSALFITGCSVAAGNEPGSAAPSARTDAEAAGGERAARAGTASGREAVRLARHGRDLDLGELRRLNALLEENVEVRGFPAGFVISLGARGTLGFWTAVRSADAGPRRPHRETVKRLRTSLGHTLAAATRTDSPAVDAWQRGLIAAGDRRQGDGADRGPYGFQTLSELMGDGEWDPRFLVAYGRALLAFEREAVENGLRPASLWADGQGSSDPVAGLLRAVSHSPGAATRLFNNRSLFARGERKGRSTAAYLLRDRDYAGTKDGTGDAALDALGAALFAAGSGRTPEDRTSEYAEPTRAQLASTRTSLQLLAAADALPPELRAGAGRLLAHHGRLTYETATEPSPAHVPFDRAVVARTITEVARDGATLGALDRALNEVAVHDFWDEKKKGQRGGGSAFRAGRMNGFLRYAAGTAFSDEEKTRLGRGPWGTAAARAVSGGGLGYVPVTGEPAHPDAPLEELAHAIAEGYRNGDADETFSARRMPTKALTESWLATNRDRLSEYQGEGIPEFDGYTLTQWFQVGFEDGEEAARQAGAGRR